MGPQQFIDHYKGIPIDFDGWYGDQCVDEFNEYNEKVVGAPFIPTPDTGGAADIYNDFDRTAAPDYYDRIPYHPGFIMQLGDVPVWRANGVRTGLAGHIAVATGVADRYTFTSLDQNWHPGHAPELVEHDYLDLLGVLRPKMLKQGEVEVIDDNITKDDYLLIDRDLDSEPEGQSVYDYWRGRPHSELHTQLYKENELMRYKSRHYEEVMVRASTAEEGLAKTRAQLTDAISASESLRDELADAKQQPQLPLGTSPQTAPAQSPRPKVDPLSSASPAPVNQPKFTILARLKKIIADVLDRLGGISG